MLTNTGHCLMAFLFLGENEPPAGALGLLTLPPEIGCCIAEKLGRADRFVRAACAPPAPRCPPPPSPPANRPLPPPPPGPCRFRLAATCSALRAASVHWFRKEVFKFEPHNDLFPAEHLAMLCRLGGELLFAVPAPCLPADC